MLTLHPKSGGVVLVSLVVVMINQSKELPGRRIFRVATTVPDVRTGLIHDTFSARLGIEKTLRALSRAYLCVSLFRACVEYLASENASRALTGPRPPAAPSERAGERELP